MTSLAGKVPTASVIPPFFVAIDLETTLNGDEDTGLAHPMHPDNRPVYYGLTDTHGTPFVFKDIHTYGASIRGYTDVATICGHNISFDLMYLFRENAWIKFNIQVSDIWDTQLAEYILSGQSIKFSSLDELCKLYGLPVKEDKIKEYFKAGIGSDKIPEEEIVPYLNQDLINTYKIAHKQYARAVAQNQLTLIRTQMAAMQATTEMMFNGLHIDKEALASYTVEVVNQYVECKLSLEELAREYVDDINSPKQWSTFFFGGTKKVKVKEEVGIYKNGNTKYKLVEKSLKIAPFVSYVPDPDKVSKTGQVSVDDAVLNDMLKHTFNPQAKLLIGGLLKYRELSKQLSTYVQGLSKHIIGDYIHGKLNHTATVTGRLSSTNPNLQNISNNPIKQIFTSRFKDGVIVEVDFNQLEVVALAHVTRDEQLIADISGGVDIHSALYEGLFGRKPTKEERKPFKARTFQLIYGAGAKAISKQAGCPLEEAKRFIEVFYERYPRVAAWHKTFAEFVDSTASYGADEHGLKNKFRTCNFHSETGRIFTFNEYFNESKWSDRMYTFSPTELKNYPVQGLATGDIVPMMLGVIFKKFFNNQNIKMVNTIHDSIMFDVKQEAAADFILDIQEVLKNTHIYFEETFKKPLALKLNAGASYGTNWYQMIEV